MYYMWSLYNPNIMNYDFYFEATLTLLDYSVKPKYIMFLKMFNVRKHHTMALQYLCGRNVVKDLGMTENQISI